MSSVSRTLYPLSKSSSSISGKSGGVRSVSPFTFDQAATWAHLEQCILYPLHQTVLLSLISTISQVVAVSQVFGDVGGSFQRASTRIHCHARGHANSSTELIAKLLQFWQFLQHGQDFMNFAVHIALFILPPGLDAGVCAFAGESHKRQVFQHSRLRSLDCLSLLGAAIPTTYPTLALAEISVPLQRPRKLGDGFPTDTSSCGLLGGCHERTHFNL